MKSTQTNKQQNGNETEWNEEKRSKEKRNEETIREVKREEKLFRKQNKTHSNLFIANC